MKTILALLLVVETLTLTPARAASTTIEPTGAIPPPPVITAPAVTAPESGSAVTTTSANGEEINFAFEAADQDVLFDEYAGLLGRTIIRSPGVPGFKATFKTQASLTRAEAIRAFNVIFAMNGVSTILYEEKFVKIVPSAQANLDSGDLPTAEGTNGPPTADILTNVPPTAEYVSEIVQLKYARPNEMMEVLKPYARIQNGLQGIESSGILVIRDHAENVRKMLQMIRLVDVTSLSPTVDPVIIPIKYALVEDIASVLSSLTSGGGGVGGTTVGGTTTGARTRGTTSRRGSIGSSTSTYGPGGVQPGVNPLGARGATPTPAAGDSFARRLNDIVNRVSAGDFEIIGNVKIIADARTNSLLIFADKHDMEMIKKIVEKLDVVLPQVLIEAIVMEVSLDDSLDFGVSAAQRPRNFTDRITGGGGINNGQAFFSSLTNAFPGGLPEGFSYFGKIGPTWDLAVEAITKDSAINVLSRPRVQTSHAKPATLFVGDTVPYVTGTSYGYNINGGSYSQYQQRDIGIAIDVTPLINPDGLVIMQQLSINIEQLGNPTRIDGNDVPTTTKREAIADVAVRDGETIILGGFISSTRSKSKSGVPILSNIPILGSVFSSSGKKNKRVELVVLMRPTVLKTPEVAAKTAEIETQKLPGIRTAEREYEADRERRLRQSSPGRRNSSDR